MLVDNGQRFVAFFDLLGFSSWLEADGSLKVFTYVRGFLNLMIRASLPGSIVHPDMSVTINSDSIACINFSDSIVFYTRDDSIECLETILNVSGGKNTAAIVRKIKSLYPDFPVLATGGPTEETIRETIEAGANAITYTPPYNGEIMSALMDRYRDK